MKKTSGIASVLVLFLALTAMGALTGIFKFQAETHDFGKIPANKPASHEFKFTNEGTSPIIISEVKPTCGCSVAEYTKTPVKPGESGSITVTYDAAVKGPFTKSFIVKSNTNTPVKNLTIKGAVE